MANAANIREVGTDGLVFEKPIPASQPGDTFPAGSVILYAGASAPTGWAICDGSNVSRATYPSYAAQMATDSYPWGAGDGSTTVGIPDFRDQVPVGKSATRALGSAGGEATHVLTAAEMPSHTHTGPSHTHSFSATSSSAGGHAHTSLFNFLYDNNTGLDSVWTQQGTAGAQFPVAETGSTITNTVASHTHTVSGTSGAGGTGATGSAGSGAAHNIMQPYKAINYIIRLY